MNNFRNLILGIVIAIFSACSSPSINQSIPVLPVSPNTDELASLLTAIKSIYLIPLEQKSDAIIGGITGLEFYGDRIFILDYQFSKSVFIYNRRGGLIKSINTKGKGPGEYVFPKDIAIDPFNKRLIIVDADGHKILLYNLNGQYISEVRLDFAPQAIGFIDEETYVFKTMSKERVPIVVTTDYKGNNNKTIYQGTFEFNRSLFSHFPRYSDSQLYNEFLNDTIYKAEKNSLNPYLFIDFLDHKVSPSTKSELKTFVNNNKRAPTIDKSLAGGIRMYQETQDFHLVLCNFLGKVSWIIHNKNTNYQIQLTKPSNQSSPLVDLIFNCINIDIQGQLVCVGYPETFDELLNSKEFIELKKNGVIETEIHGYDNQDQIDLDSNPIVALIQLDFSH